MTHPPDDVLARRVLAGETDAFRPFLERYAGTVHAAIYTVLLSRATDDVLAELASETFLSAYTGLRSLQKRESFGPWIYRIAANKAKDHARRAPYNVQHISSDLIEEETGAPLPADGPTGQQIWERETDLEQVVATALASLPEEQRVPVVLQHMRGLGVRAISEILGVPRRTVERRVAAARARLREYFEAHGLTDEVRLLQRCGPPLVGGAECLARVMADIGRASPPTPERHGRGGVGAPASVCVAGVSFVGACIVALAFVATISGGRPLRGVRGGGDLVVSLVDVEAAALPTPGPLRRPRGRRAFVETGATLGTWRPVTPLLDATRPISERELEWGAETGFVVANKEGVVLDIGRLHGIVTVDATVEIPMFGDAQASIGIVIDGNPRGVLDPAGGKQLRIEVVKHRRDVWAYENRTWAADASLSYDAAAPDGSQAWVSVADVAPGWTHVRLVLDTSTGTYDICINGRLAARAVTAPAVMGRPATGVALAASWQEHPTVMRVRGVEVWVDESGFDARRPDATVGAPIPSVQALEGTVRERVVSRSPAMAREALRGLIAAGANAAAVTVAEGLVAGLDQEYARALPSTDERMQRLREAVARIALVKQAVEGDLADTAYLTWAIRETDITWMFADRDWSGQGRGHILVALPRDDYMDDVRKLVVVGLLAEAWQRLTGRERSVDVSLRGPADLQHVALELPYAAAVAPLARRDEVAALFAITQDAVRHFAVMGALPKATTLASHFARTPQAQVARRLTEPLAATLDEDMSQAAAAYASIADGLAVLRAVRPAHQDTSLAEWLASHAPGATTRVRSDGALHVTLPGVMYYRTGDVMQGCRQLAEAAALLGGEPPYAVFLGVPGLGANVVAVARVPAGPADSWDTYRLASAP